MPRNSMPALLPLAAWLALAAMLGGCADAIYRTTASSAAVRGLHQSIEKEFDLLVKDFDAADGKGDVELCAPVRFAVARFAVYQALEERKNSGLEQMTRFISRARRTLASSEARFNSRKCVDSDGDGLTDLAEVRRYKTNRNNADTDGDGLSDGAEIKRHRTDPLRFDTDGDLLGDGEEALYLKLSPKHPDSDGDGYADGFAVTRGTDPRDHCSKPLRGPRFKGPWMKCKRSLTGRPNRRTRQTFRPNGEPLLNKNFSRGPLNP